MEAAAMWSVETPRCSATAANAHGRNPRIGPALGAVPVQHIDTELPGQRRHATRCDEIADPDFPSHADTVNAEAEPTGQIIEPCLGQHVAAFCANNGNLATEQGLLDREVADVAKQATDGRPEAVKNAKPCLLWRAGPDFEAEADLRTTAR
jgi:hypothetical protein